MIKTTLDSSMERTLVFGTRDEGSTPSRADYNYKPPSEQEQWENKYNEEMYKLKQLFKIIGGHN